MEIIDYLLARKKAGGGSDVTVEQLSVTENGTYSEQGIAYSPVVVNVPAPANSYQLKDVPLGTVSTIDDGTALPMPSLKVSIEPVQDLHGYDHPWAEGAGKNLCNTNSIENGLYSDENFTVIQPSSTIYRSYKVYLKAGTYTISASRSVRILRSIIDGVYSSSQSTFPYTFTTTADSFVGFSFRNEDDADWDINTNVQLELGSIATAWTPYSNICPISGWNKCNVNVSPTTSAEDGTTYTIQFKDGDNPLTIYGGTLDAVNGVLTVTDAYISSYNAETLPSTWISDRDVYAEGATPTTGAEVVYKLADSVTYQLTPTQIRTLVGNNNIWADTGNIIEGKYFKSLS